ncbi:MAG: hypothetical protein AAGI50_09360 [Pseudomonadota bacterium]
MRGQPHDWDLLERIALIPNEDWDRGPKHVAAGIAQLEMEADRGRMHYGERLEVDPETHLVRAVPVPVRDLTSYEGALGSVDMALRQATARNVLGAGSFEAEMLTGALTALRDWPQRVHDVFVDMHRAIAGSVAEGDLPDVPVARHLLGALERAALDIRRLHPDVAAAQLDRARLRMKEASADERAELEARLDVALSVAEPTLQDEIRADFETFTADAAHSGGDTPPRAASYRFAARVLGIATLVTSGAIEVAGGATALHGLWELIRSLLLL